ncbi:MAG TPA: universal stress protein [Clostridiales bacterium]|nr:universal stress protein [Clostridiales bacterium]
MVCVTRQRTCERLIKVGQKLCTKLEGELKVVHVAKTGDNFLGNPDEGEALDYLFQISKAAGADMTVLRAEDVVDKLVDFAEKNGVDMIIVGEGPQSKGDENIIRQLELRLPNVEIRVIPA